jgi:hypothetical protein
LFRFPLVSVICFLTKGLRAEVRGAIGDSLGLYAQNIATIISGKAVADLLLLAVLQSHCLKK